MKEIQYDPAVLQKYANRLYLFSYLIFIILPIIGMVTGHVLGGGQFRREGGSPALIGLIYGLLFAAAIAFKLRLRAQLVLCQKKIEENTRK